MQPYKVTMMIYIAVSLLAAFALVDAATQIAVIEFGKGDTVRRTSFSQTTETTVDGVTAFWSTLHQRKSGSLQHSGMPVVPNLFRQPDSGIIISISGSGVDLSALPGVTSLFETESVVGVMELPGSRSEAMLENISDVTYASAETLAEVMKHHSKKDGLSGIKINVDKVSVSSVDSQLVVVMSDLKASFKASEQTVVVHLIVEEDETSSRRRRLEDQDPNAENVEDDKEFNGYYGYAYMNKYGEWVTPYKTMFQIQYFNVVTWTAIGLVFLLFYGIFLMAYMPLEPDTLLFGESAKFVGDE